jgi:hypothetical protein
MDIDNLCQICKNLVRLKGKIIGCIRHADMNPDTDDIEDCVDFQLEEQEEV